MCIRDSDVGGTCHCKIVTVLIKFGSKCLSFSQTLIFENIISTGEIKDYKHLVRLYSDILENNGNLRFTFSIEMCIRDRGREASIEQTVEKIEELAESRAESLAERISHMFSGSASRGPRFELSEEFQGELDLSLIHI